MSLKFTKVKALITAQDTGRWHRQSYGVPISGAMDDSALFQANALVGNEISNAALEIGIGEVVMAISSGTLFALCGDGHTLLMDDIEQPHGKSILAIEDSIITLMPNTRGMWSYLAVGGGVDVPKVLGSRSTYLQAGFGGWKGKAILAGTVVEIGAKSALTESITKSLSDGSNAKWSIAYDQNFRKPGFIRIAPSPEWDWLTERQQNQLVTQPFRVSQDSNRMGYRLSGNPISRLIKDEMISSGVSKGTVQLTNEGGLVVLMADGQTVGGYPRIAQVVAVDISVLAQTRPGESIQFELISSEEAEQLFLSREKRWRQTIKGIELKFK